MPCLKTTIPLGANKTHQLFRLSRDEVAHLETPGNMCQSRQKLKSNCFIFESRLSKKKRSLFPSRSKQLRRFLLRRSWMWSLKRVRHRSPPNFTLKQTVTTGFLAHLLSLLVKRWEDVITGKPEVSNTKQSMIKTSDCKKLEKSRILFSRSSDYAIRQVFTFQGLAQRLRYGGSSFPSMRTSSFLFSFYTSGRRSRGRRNDLL